MTLHGRVLEVAASVPERTALVDGVTGERTTFGTLAGQIRTFSLPGHEVMSLWTPNLPAWAGITLGAMARGITVSPIGPAATPHEVASAVRAAGASVLVTVPAFAPAARAAADVEVVEIGPGLFGEAGEVADGAGQVALLPFSSGTTGTPKPIGLTHANLVSAIDQMHERARFAPRDAMLALAPFAHIMGSVVTLSAPLCAGATVVTLPRFEIESMLAAIERHRITWVAVPPPVMRVFAGHPMVDRFDLSSIEVIACGGAPLAPGLQAAVQARFPEVRIGQGYGMTETCAFITVPDRDEGSAPGCVGRPTRDTEVRLVEGELHVRGPHVIGDGWLATGDLAEFADNGELRIVGRLKELIKVSGYQVAPAELEALMLEFPGVEDAGVIGAPDEERGERVVAFVVGPADLDALETWLGERVAHYKRPREWHRIDALPRTPAGKLLRRELVAVAV